MYKIYVENQYFVIEITGRNEALQDHKQDVRIYPLDETTETFVVKSPLIGRHEIALADVVDETGFPYSSEEWETFYTTQTGALAMNQYDQRSIDIGVDHINANLVGNIYAICGIRVNPSSSGEFVSISSFSVMGISNDDFLVRIYKNPSIAGSVTWVDELGTPVQSFLANTNGSNTVAGQTLCASQYFVQGTFNDLKNFNVQLVGRDTYVLCVIPITAGLDVFGSINYKF